MVFVVFEVVFKKIECYFISLIVYCKVLLWLNGYIDWMEIGIVMGIGG